MIPALVPSLPETAAIVPYLRGIDRSRIGNHHAPLARAFTDRLCGFVADRWGVARVQATITGKPGEAFRANRTVAAAFVLRGVEVNARRARSIALVAATTDVVRGGE